MNFQKYILPHIWNLKPYSSARDEFKGNEGVFLDANENPFGSGTVKNWNRYPDPLQYEIKNKLAKIKNISSNQLFLGNGSDEAIDLLIRMTCKSGVHNMIICPPTYGMYEVSGNINDIEIRRVQLTTEYQLDLNTIFKSIDSNTRLIFICSPNNPTGNKINRKDIENILNEFKTGFVLIDEAYIDFSDEPSFIEELINFPNLIVLQTLSKSYGLASLRLGMAFAHPEIIGILNKIKPPYNISGATQEQVLLALNNLHFVKNSITEINIQKNKLISDLKDLGQVEKIIPSHAN
ncbi:MAG: Histidinol-phosphate transaminase, partial [Bacteroidota bacterium]